MNDFEPSSSDIPTESSNVERVDLASVNPEHLPVLDRVIASTVFFSSDGALLLGRKDADAGGVYSDKWHLPGGGVEGDESVAEAGAREFREEVKGLHIQDSDLEPLEWLSRTHSDTKTLDDGTRVWCVMENDYLRYVSDKTAAELNEILGHGDDDIIAIRFFSRQELAELEDLHPGGIEEKIVSGELSATSGQPDVADQGLV